MLEKGKEIYTTKLQELGHKGSLMFLHVRRFEILHGVNKWRDGEREFGKGFCEL